MADETTPLVSNGLTAQVVPGATDSAIPNQINAMDFAGQVVTDPQKFMTLDNPETTGLNESMFLGQRNTALPTTGFNEKGYLAANPDVAELVKNGVIPSGQEHYNTFGKNEMVAGTRTMFNPLDLTTIVNGDQAKYQMDAGALAINSPTAVSTVAPGTAATYDTKSTIGDIMSNGQMTAAQGTLSNGSIIDPNEAQLDMQGMGTGTNKDGTISYTGQALGQAAQQNIMSIIDTSTVSGKLLAQSLGEGNYTDKKATMLGQLDILSKEFIDSNGDPKIPTWAAGTARNVSKIAAFKGITGTAATQAMAQAIMEASLPIAQEESKFFQTVTLQNLNNRQEQTINRANVLSKMELSNLDNRMAAAVQNSKNFLSMDLANLDNEQQARVVNTQARIQSILEDAKSENTKRMFVAQSQNEIDMFYDNLNTNISQFNASLTQDTNKFNASLESSREQFYKEMQYNIDVSNAKWRQTIGLQEDQQQFEGAALDVRNMYDISKESLNQIWDRTDALLDYAWKTSESSLERDNNLAIQTLSNAGNLAVQTLSNAGNLARQNAENKAASNLAIGKGIGNLFLGTNGSGGLGDVISTGAGNLITKVFGGLFS